VFVGDAVEERLDVLAGLAAEIGLLGVKAFLFQEGRDSVAEQAFRKIALLTGGAYATFDLSSPERLVALLTAAGAYGARARRRGGGPPLVAIALNWRREMIYLLGGFLLFWLALSALKAFAAADPAALARMIKRGGGGAALLAGAVLLLRGRFDMALGLGGLGAWLLGLRGGSLSRMFKSYSGPRTRRVSCV